MTIPEAIAAQRTKAQPKPKAKAKATSTPRKATLVKRVEGSMQVAVGVAKVYFAGKDGVVRHVSLKTVDTYLDRAVDPAKVKAFKECGLDRLSF